MLISGKWENYQLAYRFVSTNIAIVARVKLCLHGEMVDKVNLIKSCLFSGQKLGYYWDRNKGSELMFL